MTDRVFNVLFICSTNCSRSILAEAILNRDGEGRFRAFSAGTSPAATVDADTVKVLARLGFDTSNLHPKSLDEFAGPDAPPLDFVITVCDDAAQEPSPVWPGHTISAHWGIEDPLLGVDDKDHSVCQALRFLENRIELFTNLPFDKLDRISLHSEVSSIGKTEGASAAAAA